MKRVLYIGKSTPLSDQLQATEGAQVVVEPNAIGFYDHLEKLDEFDLVLACEELPGLSGSGLFKRFRERFLELKLPFILVAPMPKRAERMAMLETGIIEIYSTEMDAEVMLSRIPFLKEMLIHRSRIRVEEKNTDYKIPLSKRLFDIVVGSIAFLVALPIMLLAVIAIRLESKGPIFYISKRVGTGYKVFDFYKFRSMYVDADQRVKEMQHLNQYSRQAEKEAAAPKKAPVAAIPANGLEKEDFIDKQGQRISEEEFLEQKKKQQAGTFVKFKDDPRVTKVGKFLRNTSIDELPQIINVLKGDMSIVGNRPLPLYEAEQLTSDDWGERFLAPAGITGLWQVMKRGGGEMSEEERKGLDNQYARNVSLWNDIKLILMTIPALFQKENV